MEYRNPNDRPTDEATDRPMADRPEPDRPAVDRPGGDMSGAGRLVFQVSTAGGAIPLEGAEVTIRSFRSLTDGSGGDVLNVLYSGRDGKTEMLTLPAPAKNFSLEPARDGMPVPYALYDADVRFTGFYEQGYTRIPVFDGITSIQHVTLIPLPENGIVDGVRPDGEQFFEGENPDL